MRIAFVWDWDIVPPQAITWRDGLSRAIKILGERHDVKVFAEGKVPYTLPHTYFDINVCTQGEGMVDSVREFEPDVILHWADTTRPNAKPLFQLGIPMALCFAGGNPFGETHTLFDHIFVESDVYYEQFKDRGFSVSKAFGTNTTLFSPNYTQSKYIDAFFPATYCLWKRQQLFTDAVQGLRACTAGWMYEKQERDCWEYPEKRGILVLPHLSAKALQRMYAASRCVVITSRSDGGSQRTVLEAMAMNIPVVVTEDSDKTTEYIKASGWGHIAKAKPNHIRNAIHEALETKPTSRDWILENYSEDKYASDLEEGLLNLCKRSTPKEDS